MSVVIGVHPGGKNKFAVCALFWNGRPPASLFRSRSYSGVDEVLADIVGTYGEWGDLKSVAIDAPLTWAGSHSGWRPCDLALRKALPKWAPRTWIRPPNTLPGAISVQGPALAWALAHEIKRAQLPEHSLVETHPRLALSHIASDLQAAVLGYRNRDLKPARLRAHLTRLTQRIVDAGIVRMETEPPQTADELDAMVCAVTALGKAEPDSGLVLAEWAGGEIRPVGKRPLVILRALP